MNQKTIGVAIASFNGMKFIEQQLQSICTQTLLPSVISISDDASTDGTQEFLERFKSQSKIPVILSLNTKRLGVIENFMVAFRNCNTDYIAYCDQDDYWHSDKLSTCASRLERDDVSLIFHQSTTVDETLVAIGGVNPSNLSGGIYRFPHLPDNLWGFGHQMIFSREVLEVMSAIKDSPCKVVASIGTCFDFSLLVAAGMVGNIYFVKKQLMKFRRHDGSVSPAGKSGNANQNERASDWRRLRVQEFLNIITSIQSESIAGRLLGEDTERSKIYREHLLLLERRYARRRTVYDTESRSKRLISLAQLVFSRAYGSVRNQNKLKVRQFLLDCFRALSGPPRNPDDVT
jgi:glycosyltransferase involved in cell wall biosynthesis